MKRWKKRHSHNFWTVWIASGFEPDFDSESRADKNGATEHQQMMWMVDWI
jgi:hypothetical protein